MKNFMSFLQLTGIFALIMVPFLSQAQNDIQYYRPYDKRGASMFETPKTDNGADRGFKVRIGGNFAQQFQSLKHENTAAYVPTSATDSTNANKLIDLGNGFNLATANLNIDAQLADGIRINMVSYLSARHHQESWVKGGYIQFDKLPFFQSDAVDKLMENLTIKVGHYEVNYGDAHFRRSDNGAALYNPFIENLILDAFNTEIGGELIYQKNGLLAVGAITSGEIKGDVVKIPDLVEGVDVDNSSKKAPAFVGKLGIDKQVNEDFRIRVTGSTYYTASSRSNNLYGGDRAGSRYYLVMENTKATTDANYYSGRLRPGFGDKVFSLMGNAFLKYKGLEIFGTVERATGRGSKEKDPKDATKLGPDRVIMQYAADVMYRFGKDENFYLAGRYNTVNAELAAAGANFGVDKPVSISRYEISAGWYVNANILAKVAYINQEYKDYPTTSIFNGGKFNGLMVEAVVGF